MLTDVYIKKFNKNVINNFMFNLINMKLMCTSIVKERRDLNFHFLERFSYTLILHSPLQCYVIHTREAHVSKII